jgi:hypothetical protein
MRSPMQLLDLEQVQMQLDAWVLLQCDQPFPAAVSRARRTIDHPAATTEGSGGSLFSVVCHTRVNKGI